MNLARTLGSLPAQRPTPTVAHRVGAQQFGAGHTARWGCFSSSAASGSLVGPRGEACGVAASGSISKHCFLCTLFPMKPWPSRGQ